MATNRTELDNPRRMRVLTLRTEKGIRIALIGVVAATCVCLVLAGPGSAVGTRRDPHCCVPDDGASVFSLSVTGKVSGGATVQTKLKFANPVGLFVGLEAGNGNEEPLGLVSFGSQSQKVGAHRIPWNLSVGGQPLGAGKYEVLFEIFDGHGHPSGAPPSPTYAFLTISKAGRDSVRFEHLRLIG